jgi:transposase
LQRAGRLGAHLIAVAELSLSGWLVAGVVPGVERQPLKKLKPEPDPLQELLQRLGNEAERSGRTIARTLVAYEAGRDGFWLARTRKGRRRSWSITRHNYRHFSLSKFRTASRNRKIRIALAKL